jgi:hypothetical protein
MLQGLAAVTNVVSPTEQPGPLARPLSVKLDGVINVSPLSGGLLQYSVDSPRIDYLCILLNV